MSVMRRRIYVRTGVTHEGWIPFLSCRSLALFFSLFLLGSGFAYAQFGIYGMGTGGRESGSGVATDGAFTAWGGTGGIYDDFVHLGPARLGADGRFFIENSGNSAYGNKLSGGLAGGRLDVGLPLVPLRPYVQAEVGAASSNNGTNPSKMTGFAYQVQFGLDVTIFPHLDLRGEYGAGQIFLSGNSPGLQQFGGGLVLRL
jgi:hypothetical protein